MESRRRSRYPIWCLYLLLLTVQLTISFAADVSKMATVVLEAAPDAVETICLRNTQGGKATFSNADTLLVGSKKVVDDGFALCAAELEVVVYDDGVLRDSVDAGQEWSGVGWRVPILSRVSSAATLDVVVNNNIASDLSIMSLPTPPSVVEGGRLVLPSRFQVASKDLSLWKEGSPDLVLSYLVQRWKAVVEGPRKVHAALIVHRYAGRVDSLTSRVVQVVFAPAEGDSLQFAKHEVDFHSQAGRKRRLLQADAAPPPPQPPAGPCTGDYCDDGSGVYNPDVVGCTWVCWKRNPYPAGCYYGPCTTQCGCY